MYWCLPSSQNSTRIFITRIKANISLTTTTYTQADMSGSSFTPSQGNSPNSLMIDLAKLLNVNIDETTLQLCIKLLDQGVDPLQLADSINKVNNETSLVLN